MTTVPPANSTPLGMPLVAIARTPAMMIAHESTSAWTRHRRKLKLACLKMCISLDTQRGDLLTIRQHRLEQRLRHENGREQVRRQTEEQRRREPADRPRAELEEERARDKRGHVRVDQRPEDAAEAGVDRRADTAL